MLDLCDFRSETTVQKGLRQRTAENLLELEKGFSRLEDTLPLIDPASKRYEGELKFAVENSIQQVPQEQRSDPERGLILGLDRFLRFMLLLTALVNYELIKADALEYEYWYWFDAIRNNSHLRSYTEKYFPTLARALNDETLTPRARQT
jgi:hypothetical protein